MPVGTDPRVMPSWLEEEPDGLTPFVPPEIPAWLLEAPVTMTEPSCGCECAAHDEPPAVVAPEPVRWAVPGLWGPDPEPLVPTVGTLVSEIQERIDKLGTVDPAGLSEGQALGEAAALLAVHGELRRQQLARTQDLADRKLVGQLGFRSTKAWIMATAPDADPSDSTLAGRLHLYPALAAALRAGVLSVTGARKLATSLMKVRVHLDRPDGLIDNQPGEETIAAVVTEVIELVCKDRYGLAVDPAENPEQAALLAALEAAVQQIRTQGGSQLDRYENALVLLGRHVHPRNLAGPLEHLELALLPTTLEDQNAAAQDTRGLALLPNRDGTWDLQGTLTPECGEQLFTALAAEARRDPRNPQDTDLWSKACADSEAVPRTRSQRLHDAFNRLLGRYLTHGLGGTRSKVPVQIRVTLTDRTVTGAPGAPPGRGASGRPLARSLIRRWWCDAHITTLLMSRGFKPLGIVHSGRTLTGTELTAAQAQSNNRCAGDGCCSDEPDMLTPLVPHHIVMHSVGHTTSLDETLMICPTLHHDIHTGKKTIRLRDGRLLNENGYVSTG